MRRVFSTAIAAALLPLAAQAQWIQPLPKANPLPGKGNFEVVERAGAGPRLIWCSAARHVRAELGAGHGSRIFILEGRGPSKTAPGRKAVAFTIAPPARLADGPRPGEGGNYSLSVSQPGFSLAFGHAEGFCVDLFEAVEELYYPGRR